jgi:HEAT repeat protein
MTLESLLEGIADPEGKLSATQLASLSDLADEDSQELAEAWAEIPPDRRLRIINELAELAADNVDLNFDAIYKLALTDEDAHVREAAIRGLYEYEGRDLISPLANLLRNDPAVSVRREAAIALGRYAVAAELGYLSDGDVVAVRDALTESSEDLDEDEKVRARAIEALGAITDEETENLIESIYQEDNIWLKVGAVDAMGRSCNEVWLPTILQEMQNRAPEMRHAAAFAAGEIGDEEAVQPLKRMAIEDPDREVQLAAIHSLGEIGGAPARVALQAVLFEGDDSLREAVEEAMAEIAFNDDPLRPSGL